MAQDFQVFICYSPVDKEKGRELYNHLQAVEGVKPWLDEEDLLPGQDWKRETRRALRQSSVILILLSKTALRTPAFSNSLIKDALDVADEQPEGVISVVPVRLEECELPYSLEERNLHPLDYFKPDGFKQLIRVLNAARPAGRPALSIPEGLSNTSGTNNGSGQPPANEELSADRDVIRVDQNKGIINTGKMGNLNTGSGQQHNIAEQNAARDFYQGNNTVIHNYYGSSASGAAPSAHPDPKPHQNQNSNSTDFAKLIPEFTQPTQLLSFADELLKCEAMSNNNLRSTVINFLPSAIRNNVNDTSAARIHVLNIVQTCNRYPGGLAQLLEAVHLIEGDTIAWQNLVNYLAGLKH